MLNNLKIVPCGLWRPTKGVVRPQVGNHCSKLSSEMDFISLSLT